MEWKIYTKLARSVNGSSSVEKKTPSPPLKMHINQKTTETNTGKLQTDTAAHTVERLDAPMREKRRSGLAGVGKVTYLKL